MTNTIKRFVSKLTALLLIFSILNIPATGAYFTDIASVSSNTISTGCWEAPSTPQLVYPSDGYVAYLGTDWYTYPYMDWSDSTTSCPMGIVQYVYQSYHDENLTSLAYHSGYLSSSQIPAPGTPDGTYFWRVKATDGYNESEWSNVWLLTVDSDYVEPTPTPPPTAGRIVINEVYYDVLSAHTTSGNEIKNEWVELYNAGDTPVNISGWKIRDNTTERTIPITSDILPNGFVVITPDASTWGYWPGIPTAATKIVLEDNIGNGLQNQHDRVILKDNTGAEIDAVSWGSGAGADTYAFNPAVPDVPAGHSISRKVKGVDTNTAADWMDTHAGSDPAGPNPGTNPHNDVSAEEPNTPRVETQKVQEEIEQTSTLQIIPVGSPLDEDVIAEEEIIVDNPNEETETEPQDIDPPIDEDTQLLPETVDETLPPEEEVSGPVPLENIEE